MEKVLEKAASDPDWKQQYLDNPEEALQASGFPEVEPLRRFGEEIKAQQQERGGEDVQGHDYVVTYYVDVITDYYVCYSCTCSWVCT